jgi:hypothetical protein
MASFTLRSRRLVAATKQGWRTYATGPERRPMRRPDPLVNNPNATTAELSDGLTFIHRPPPSLPSALSLSSNPASPLLREPTAAPENTPLPPSLNEIKPPKARLTDEQIQELRRLRASAPETYTQKKLAQMFNTTPSTVGMVATLPQAKRTAARQKFFAAHDEQRGKWGEKKSIIRDIRKKRREFW